MFIYCRCCCCCCMETIQQQPGSKSGQTAKLSGLRVHFWPPSLLLWLCAMTSNHVSPQCILSARNPLRHTTTTTTTTTTLRLKWYEDNNNSSSDKESESTSEAGRCLASRASNRRHIARPTACRTTRRAVGRQARLWARRRRYCRCLCDDCGRNLGI